MREHESRSQTGHDATTRVQGLQGLSRPRGESVEPAPNRGTTVTSRTEEMALRIVTDCPGRLAGFPASAGLTEVAGGVAGLALGDQRLLGTFEMGPRVWASDLMAAHPSDFWHRVVIREHATTSQFDALHAAIGAGLRPEGPTACLALAGRGFRGQCGRSWACARGNLFLTVALPLFTRTVETAHGLVALPAVAVIETLRVLHGRIPTPKIKWVNDVLVDGKKIAGTVIATHCRGEWIEWAEVGIGVNIASVPDVAPTPLVPEVGCLNDFDPSITLPAFFTVLLEQLAILSRRLLGPERDEITRRYRDATSLVGRSVRVWPNQVDNPRLSVTEPIAAGVVGAILDDLSLQIEGYPEPISNGRLAFEEVCRDFGL